MHSEGRDSELCGRSGPLRFAPGDCSDLKICIIDVPDSGTWYANISYINRWHDNNVHPVFQACVPESHRPCAG